MYLIGHNLQDLQTVQTPADYHPENRLSDKFVSQPVGVRRSNYTYIKSQGEHRSANQVYPTTRMRLLMCGNIDEVM